MADRSGIDGEKVIQDLNSRFAAPQPEIARSLLICKLDTPGWHVSDDLGSQLALFGDVQHCITAEVFGIRVGYVSFFSIDDAQNALFSLSEGTASSRVDVFLVVDIVLPPLLLSEAADQAEKSEQCDFDCLLFEVVLGPPVLNQLILCLKMTLADEILSIRPLSVVQLAVTFKDLRVCRDVLKNFSHGKGLSIKPMARDSVIRANGRELHRLLSYPDQNIWKDSKASRFSLKNMESSISLNSVKEVNGDSRSVETETKAKAVDVNHGLLPRRHSTPCMSYFAGRKELNFSSCAGSFICCDSNESRTTVVLKNVPSSFSTKQLNEKLLQEFPGQFDFAYVPLDVKTGKCPGYAFINFFLPGFVEDFHHWVHAKEWFFPFSTKPVFVFYARIQGFEKIRQWFSKPEILQLPSKYQPIAYVDGKQMAIGSLNKSGSI